MGFGIAALFFQCGFADSDVHFSVLSGADEDVGRAILANLAGEPPAKLSATPMNLPECIHLSFLWREQMLRVLRWAEHVKYSMTLRRRSAWADFSPTTSGSSLSRHRSLDGFANLWSG